MLPSSVALMPAAQPAEAQANFGCRLSLESERADVHEVLAGARARRPTSCCWTCGDRAPTHAHVRRAVNLLHGRIDAESLVRWPDRTLLVVYSASRHCNGAGLAASGWSGWDGR